jgi:hypothetical protein
MPLLLKINLGNLEVQLKEMFAAGLCLAIWLCMSAVQAAECPEITPGNQPRVQIPFFQYSGTEVGEARNQFSRFQGIIKVKLTALIDELQHPAGDDESPSVSEFPRHSFTYFEKLGIQLPGGEPIKDTLTTTDKREYWEVTNALELLRGTLWPGTPYYVTSEIYIGELRGSFPRNEVLVRLSIEPEMVPTTNDTHSLVTYYVLAMDARRLKCDPALVDYFLSRAWSILQDLKGRRPGLIGDLAAMEAALSKELARPGK